MLETPNNYCMQGSREDPENKRFHFFHDFLVGFFGGQPQERGGEGRGSNYIDACSNRQTVKEEYTIGGAFLGRLCELSFGALAHNLVGHFSAPLSEKCPILNLFCEQMSQ